MNRSIVVGVVSLLGVLGLGVGQTSQHLPTTLIEASRTCWVQDELLMDGDCDDHLQEQADAAWEGLSAEDQHVIDAIGLNGSAQDQLIIDYRQTQLGAAGLEGSYYTQVTSDHGVFTAELRKIEEDHPMWDCRTMGNKICGSELPRTS